MRKKIIKYAHKAQVTIDFTLAYTGSRLHM